MTKREFFSDEVEVKIDNKVIGFKIRINGVFLKIELFIVVLLDTSLIIIKSYIFQITGCKFLFIIVCMFTC